MISRAYLASPIRVREIHMITISRDQVEFWEYQYNGDASVSKKLDRTLPYPEAINFRAHLIRVGWSELTAPEIA